MDNILELKNVNKLYGNQVKTQVLFDINLSFKKGEFSSIIGQSGSGKSTLLNILGTLDKQTSGDVLIDNKNINTLKKNEIAKIRNETLGFIFQFHYLLPEFTAKENILLPYKIKNKKVSEEVNNRVDELMNLTGIYNVKDNLATNMSGGQQQRTAIARALVNNPKILLADEPTGNLDSDSTEKVYEILREINIKFETTFVIITHDRRIAEKADRIIEIKDGKVYLDVNK